MLFSTLKKNNIEKCPFTYWLNGRWFLQIVDGDSWNLYPLYPITKIVVLVSEPVRGRSRATELPCCNVFFLTFWVFRVRGVLYDILSSGLSWALNLWCTVVWFMSLS